ncbi:MAG: putative signal transducing protein [Solirubrobacterales bacterium]
MEELVEIAFVGNEYEGAVIQALLEENGIPSLQQQVGPSGPQLGYGLMNTGGGARRVMVHAHRAEEARTLLAEAEAVADLPEPVNAEYLEDAQGDRKPRNYGVVGAYARSLFWSLVGLALLVGVVMLLHMG